MRTMYGAMKDLAVNGCKYMECHAARIGCLQWQHEHGQPNRGSAKPESGRQKTLPQSPSGSRQEDSVGCR